MSAALARPQRRDAAENRTALLDAARLLLNQDPDASLESIASAAGLSRRAVYGHFASRDELLGELVRLGTQRIAAALDGIEHPDPVMRIALIGSRLWYEVENVRVMTVITLRGPLKKLTDDALARLRASMGVAIDAGKATGGIRTDIETARLVRLLEDSATAVLDESIRSPLAGDEGQRLIISNMLGVIGFGWRETEAFLTTHTELLRKDAA